MEIHGKKRIVSFLPSATEILFELGEEDKIKAVTHECDFPLQAKNKPKIITSSFDTSKLQSGEIEFEISKRMKSGAEIFVLDEQILRDSDPDLVICQDICEVCSPATRKINQALSVLKKRPEILVLDPHDIEDIFRNILDVAESINQTKKAQNLVNSLRKRVDYIKSKAIEKRPKVLCIEWLSPFYSAGHWVPQMVEIAGGTNCISKTGERSRLLTPEEIDQADAEVIILMPCGFDLRRTCIELERLSKNSSLKNLVNNKDIYCVDSNSFFSKPGPRVITGVEILAKIIHPETFSNLTIPNNSFLKVQRLN